MNEYIYLTTVLLTVHFQVHQR